MATQRLAVGIHHHSHPSRPDSSPVAIDWLAQRCRVLFTCRPRARAQNTLTRWPLYVSVSHLHVLSRPPTVRLRFHHPFLPSITRYDLTSIPLDRRLITRASFDHVISTTQLEMGQSRTSTETQQLALLLLRRPVRGSSEVVGCASSESGQQCSECSCDGGQCCYCARR